MTTVMPSDSLKFADQVHDFDPGMAVQVAGRLVRQQDAGC